MQLGFNDLVTAAAFTDLASLRTWLDERTDILDIAQAIRHLPAAVPNKVVAGIMAVRCERRIGQLLSTAELVKGGRPKKGQRKRKPVGISNQLSLSALGLDKAKSWQYQQLAMVPSDWLETELESCRTMGRAPRSSTIVKRWKAEQATADVESVAQAVDAGEGVYVDSLAPLVDEIKAGVREPFACVYADPPWRFDNLATRGAAADHYPTMSLDEIAALPVAQIVAPRALLWLWVTSSHLPKVWPIITAWGFAFKTSMVWSKGRPGLGNFVRNSHELLLIANRGGLLTRRKNQLSVVQIRPGRHSSKPAKFRDIIEGNSPDPRIELFGRHRVPGWMVFGNEPDLLGSTSMGGNNGGASPQAMRLTPYQP